MKFLALASLVLTASGCSVAISSDLEAGPSTTCKFGNEYTVSFQGELPNSVELAVRRGANVKLKTLMNTYDGLGEVVGRVYGNTSRQVEINLDSRKVSVHDYTTHSARSTDLSNCF